MDNKEAVPEGAIPEVKSAIVTNVKKPNYLILVIIGILIFSVGTLGGILLMTAVSNQKPTTVATNSSTSLVSSNETLSSESSSISTSTSSITSSTNTSELNTIPYKVYEDSLITVSVPSDSSPKVNLEYPDEPNFFHSLDLKYKQIDIHVGDGFCMDYNCDGHTLTYDLTQPLGLVWEYENMESTADDPELITNRKGSYTFKKEPDKILSKDGNYMFLYSEELKSIDNKKLDNFQVFLKSDGKFKALTWGGNPSFFTDTIKKVGGEYYYITSSIKSSSEFKLCGEVLLKVLQTFQKKNNIKGN